LDLINRYANVGYPLRALAVPALPLGKLGGCLGRWAKGSAELQLCGSESDERIPKMGMNMMKVNETHDQSRIKG